MSGSWRPNRTAIYIDPHSYDRQRCVFLVLEGCSTGGPLCWVRDFSTASCHQQVSKHHRGSRGPLRPGVAFLTTSYQQLLLTPTQSGAPRAPSAWCGFPYHILSITPTVWLLVLTELYNSSTPTQSSEWHVWSSSSGNKCHAVHGSLSSGASVYECTMGFFLPWSHFISQIPPTRFLSITGHWDVSLPSSASLWNSIFARVEGQNTTMK